MDQLYIQSRLDALEQHATRLDRRLEHTLYGWLLTSAVFLLAAWAPSQAARSRKGETDVLRVRQLVIVDDKGTERVVIGPVPDPQVRGKRLKRRSPATGLQVNDGSGNERAGLAILDDGSAVVGIDDEAGRERAHLYFMPGRGAGLLLQGAKGKEAVSLSVHSQGEQSASPKLEMRNQSGDAVATIPAQ